ncbi:MAG TPA: hypothetical protein VIK18_26720 [Pirellulales bacterium]
MKQALIQTCGAVLLGAGLGLAAHCAADAEDRNFWLLIVIVACGAGGVYLMFVHTLRRRVVFKFEGGFMDGKTLIGDLKDQAQGKSANEAVRHYFNTDRGAVGQRFWSASDYMVDTLRTHGGDVTALRAASRDPRFQCDHYEVVDRREKDSEIHVRAKFIPS